MQANEDIAPSYGSDRWTLQAAAISSTQCRLNGTNDESRIRGQKITILPIKQKNGMTVIS